MVSLASLMGQQKEMRTAKSLLGSSKDGDILGPRDGFEVDTA
jgi:hypothetical protein